MKWKPIVLSLSAASIVATPIIVVSVLKPIVKMKKYKILPTYTGQADQLIALGIAPDYYPVQLNEKHAYKYLTDPRVYMDVQHEVNPDFARKFEDKIKSLFSQISEVGRTWWNMNAEKNDNTNPNKEYWTTKEGKITLYEHYLLDDDKKIIDNEESPSYDASIQTNFRWSADPYTRISEENIKNIEKNETETIHPINGRIPIRKLYLEFQRILGLKTKVINSNGTWTYNIIPDMWRGENNEDFVVDKNRWLGNEALFNDAYFALKWHINFLDNPELAEGGDGANFSSFICQKNDRSVFNLNRADDEQLAKIFEQATISNKLKQAGLTHINYPYKTLRHHPIYDAQTRVGEAPIYEGARRENMLYLYNLASQLTHTVKGQDLNGNLLKDTSLRDKLRSDFIGDDRWEKMENALENANKIAGNLNERLNAIKEYFKAINVSGKTIALITIAPGGGVSTIQTNSKYSFIFDKTGMKYAMPKPEVWSKLNEYKIGGLFSMDDNGWFWDIGTGENDLKNAKAFENQADLEILTVRDKEWAGMTDQMKLNLSLIEKGNTNLADKKANYDLWNEGLKTPFVINMILDDYVKKIEDLAPKYLIEANKNKQLKALNWGKYWTDEFINS